MGKLDKLVVLTKVDETLHTLVDATCDCGYVLPKVYSVHARDCGFIKACDILSDEIKKIKKEGE